MYWKSLTVIHSILNSKWFIHNPKIGDRERPWLKLRRPTLDTSFMLGLQKDCILIRL